MCHAVFCAVFDCSTTQVEDVEALVDCLIPASAYTTYQQQLAQGRQLQEQQEDEALAAEAGRMTPPAKPRTRSAGRQVPKGLSSAGKQVLHTPQMAV